MVLRGGIDRTHQFERYCYLYAVLNDFVAFDINYSFHIVSITLAFACRSIGVNFFPCITTVLLDVVTSMVFSGVLTDLLSLNVVAICMAFMMAVMFSIAFYPQIFMYFYLLA